MGIINKVYLYKFRKENNMNLMIKIIIKMKNNKIQIKK